MKELVKYGCAICGKGVQHINLVSFSKNRVKSIRRPNLHTQRMVVDGESVKLKVCTRCKRALREEVKSKQKAAAK